MAVNDPTTNYAWDLPLSGGDSGAWGTLLNAILGDDSTGIDAVLYAASVVASAALPKAGGTMTGAMVVATETFTPVNLGTGLSGAVALNLATGNVFYGTVTGACTISFSNIPAGAVFVTLELEFSGGPYGITFPSGTTFGQDSLKTTLLNRVQMYCLYTRNSGTDWRAAHLANMTP